MNGLASAPGVLGEVLPTYVTVYDVMDLLGCKDNSAYTKIRAINKLALETGKMAYGQGKANKYMFADNFGIPLDVVDAVIHRNQNRERRKKSEKETLQ